MLSASVDGGSGSYPTVETPNSNPNVQPTPAGYGDYQNELISFNPEDIVEKIKLSWPFKIHAFVGLGGSILAIVIWFFVGIGIDWFPWFIYVVLFFALTLGAHYYIVLREKEFLQFHMFADIAINSVLILTWIATIPKNVVMPSLWFAYPLLGTLCLLLFHYLYVKKNEGMKQLLLTYHGFLTAILSAVFFAIWIETSLTTSKTWFVIVDIILVALYLIHQSFSKGLELLTLNVKMCGCGSVLLYSIWLIYGNNKFPWFIFPVGAWAALVVVHFFLTRNVSGKSAPEN